MGLRHAIASSLHLFVVLAFFAAGSFFVSLPFLPELRLHAADFLLCRLELCTWIGCGIFFVALLLLLGFYGLSRGRVLSLKMGQNLVSIESTVIRETLEACFAKNFPHQIALADVEILNGKKLEISVTLSPLGKKEQDQLFIDAEKSLQTLLKERFGYTKPFYLIVKSIE